MANFLTDAEMAALEAQNQPHQASGPKVISDEDMQKLEASAKGLNVINNEGANVKHRIGQALNWLGGNVRNIIAQPIGLAKEGDTIKALKGEAPSSAEYMQRAGIPEGPSLSDVLADGKVLTGIYTDTGHDFTLKKHGAADPTARGAAGVAADTALDPLTYVSGPAATAADAGKLGWLRGSIEKALNPIKNVTEHGGESLYKSAFKNIDKALIAEGKAPISGDMLASGFTGNMQQARAARVGMQRAAGQQRGQIMGELGAAGLTGSTDNATKQALALTAKMRESPSPEVVAAADKLDDIIAGYLSKGENIPIEKIDEWGTEASNLGRRAYSPNVPDVPYKTDLYASLGTGLKNEVRNAASEFSPEMRARLDKINQIYGSSKESAKAFKTEANKEVTKNWVSQIDALGGGALATAALYHPQSVPLLLGAMAGKKTIQGLNSTRGRTMIGKGLYDIGTSRPLQSGAVDSLNRNLWTDILNQNQEQK